MIAMKYGRYGSNFTRSPAPPRPRRAKISGPTQQADARNADRIEPALAANVARELPAARLGGGGTGQHSSEDAVMSVNKAWTVPDRFYLDNQLVTPHGSASCLQTGRSLPSKVE